MVTTFIDMTVRAAGLAAHLSAPAGPGEFLAAHLTPAPERTDPDLHIQFDIDPALPPDEYRLEGADAARVFRVSLPETRWEDVIFNSLSQAILRAGRALGALELHASAVVIDGRVFVFPAPSGTGKTTLANMAPAGADVLNDEHVVLFPDRKPVQAAGVPHSLRYARAAGLGPLPLAGIFLLRQGDTHAVRRLTGAEAVARMLVLPARPDASGQDAAKQLEAFTVLAHNARVFELTFRRDPGFWPLVLASVTGLTGADT